MPSITEIHKRCIDELTLKFATDVANIILRVSFQDWTIYVLSLTGFTLFVTDSSVLCLSNLLHSLRYL